MRSEYQSVGWAEPDFIVLSKRQATGFAHPTASELFILRMNFMNIAFQMELPESIFAVLHQDKEELVNTVKLCAAVKLYELHRLSQEKASELAGMSRGEFLLALKDFEVTPYQYGAQEILSEVRRLGF